MYRLDGLRPEGRPAASIEIFLTASARRDMNRHGVHKDEIKYCIRDGEIIQTIMPTNRTLTYSEFNKRQNRVKRRWNHIEVVYASADRTPPNRKRPPADYDVICIHDAKYRGFSKISIREHNDPSYVCKAIYRTINTIPRFDPAQVKTMDIYPNVEAAMCQHEIQSVLQSPGTWYELAIEKPKNILECLLIRRSPYRTACNYLGFKDVTKKNGSPLGLLHEAFILRQCVRYGIGCPRCGGRLALGGGSSTAWADIVCTACPTYIEVKTRGREKMRRLAELEVRGQPVTDDGGSHRWFHAQRNEGIEHFAIIVPKDGGMVNIGRITRCVEKVDAKFLAALNLNRPERVLPTLKSTMELGPPTPLFEIDDSKQRQQLYRKTAKTQIKKTFGAYARKIQNAWRKATAAGTDDVRVDMDWEEIYEDSD